MTTAATTAPELLPCPFCGETNQLKQIGHRTEYVECLRCAAYGPDGGEPAWNRRAAVAQDVRSFPGAADGRPMPPMGDDLMIAGLSQDDARFAAIQLARNGLTLVPVAQDAEPVALTGEQWGAAVNAMTHIFRRDMDVTRCPSVTTCKDALDAALSALHPAPQSSDEASTLRDDQLADDLDALVAELRADAELHEDLLPDRAADAIATLRAQLAEAMDALEPFAAMAALYDPPDGDDELQAWAYGARPTIGQLRRARFALRKLKGDE